MSELPAGKPEVVTHIVKYGAGLGSQSNRINSGRFKFIYKRDKKGRYKLVKYVEVAIKKENH